MKILKTQSKQSLVFATIFFSTQVVIDYFIENRIHWASIMIATLTSVGIWSLLMYAAKK